MCIFSTETRLYTNCVRKYIFNRLEKSLECYLPGLKGLIDSKLKLPICGNDESAKKTCNAYENASYEFLDEGSFNECYMPCRQTSYLQNLKYSHSTAYRTASSTAFEGFELTIAYISLDVKTKTETFAYDIGDVFAAAGGNLGLFLGFSCLGCIWSFFNLCQAYTRRN